MKEITDDYMKQMLTVSRDYSAVVLRAGPAASAPGADKIIWEHGRRNFVLRAERILSIVCPVRDGSEVRGVGIFNGSVDEIGKVMDDDPEVKAGVLVYEIHACRGFPAIDCRKNLERRPPSLLGLEGHRHQVPHDHPVAQLQEEKDALGHVLGFRPLGRL